MISVGKSLLNNAEPLKKVTIDYLYHSLRNPKPEVESRIRQLRIVRDIDSKQYALLKRQLPYFVCGMFNPPFRKNENFAYTEYFIVDIDHLSDKEMDIDQLSAKLAQDPRILLLFRSPGEDGLKILFKLQERCYDATIYSLFYKVFIKQFSAQYQLEQVVDARTSDVSRACFISMDAHAHYRPDAENVNLNDYINKEDTSGMLKLKKEIEKEERSQETGVKVQSEEAKEADPDEQTMNHIRSLLNPKAAKKTQEAPCVPSELEEIINDLKQYIEQTGIEVQDIHNIQYAKKIKCRLGLKQAEINLFYGKRGFTVVQSPRCGTSAELNQLVSEVINSYLQTI